MQRFIASVLECSCHTRTDEFRVLFIYIEAVLAQ